jgi:hypothetical protein
MGVTAIQKNTTDSQYKLTDKVNSGGNKEDKVKITQDSKSEDENSAIIQASDLNLAGTQDTGLKKLLGQRAALQIQLSQFEKEIELDDTIQEHAANRETLLEEAGTNQGQVRRLNGLKSELKEACNIDDDSTEQQDFLILEKKLLKKDLTKDEQERLANMGPMTEYQKAALEYSNMANIYQKRADEAVERAYQESGMITAIKLERLKTHPMADANELAEDLLKQVDEEVKQTLAQEVMNRVKDNLDIVEEDLLLNNPQLLVEKKKVTEEDLKGLAVDQKV